MNGRQFVACVPGLFSLFLNRASPPFFLAGQWGSSIQVPIIHQGRVELSAYCVTCETIPCWSYPCFNNFPDMNPTDKKTTLLASPEEPLDTEKLLLERMKNSSSSEDYFRWMLFVVGFTEASTTLKRPVVCSKALSKSPRISNNPLIVIWRLEQIATRRAAARRCTKTFHECARACAEETQSHLCAAEQYRLLSQYARPLVEGEKHCRCAIDIDWTRASAFRNLGISLNGQGNVLGAVWALTEAVRADAADGRAAATLTNS